MEPNLSPFKTNLFDERGNGQPAYLITSPEYSCKKMLGAGMEKIFSLGKVFRNNEPMGGAHNHEFTMLEWYRAGENYEKLMDDTERLVKHCAKVLDQFPKNGVISDASSVGQQPLSIINRPWQRLSVKEAFAQIGLNLDQILTRATIAKAASDRGYAVLPNDSFDDCFFKVFLTEIEPKLGLEEPVILYDYPVQMAALARAKPSDPRYAERFEIYANGLELANAFSELTDPVEQKNRFLAEAEEKRILGKDVPPLDDDLLAALSQIDSAAGIALGVDRLVMLLAGARSIEDVILFPVSELFKA
jgi:lysyl-tRNA synthetase class 2